MTIERFTEEEAGRQAIEVCRIIKEAGKQAYLVGGCVRDTLMGRYCHDWDIATDATPDQILRLFDKVIPTGLKHGTVTVVRVTEEGSFTFEVTTFRGDGVYSDGRRPDSVVFSESIEQDLARRDFTMNAIAYCPVDDRFVDPFGGAADILMRRIRAVGDPDKRFAEDGLRALRACRFAATLEFEIDPPTLSAICRHHETFRRVSVERVAQEWAKILEAYTDPSVAFRLMARTGLLWITVPELEEAVGFEQNDYHEFDVFEHTMQALKNCPSLVVGLAALFHDVAKPSAAGTHPDTGKVTFYEHEERGAEMVKAILTRMKFPSHVTDQVSHLVRHHLIPRDNLSAAGLRRWLRRVSNGHPHTLGQLECLAFADAIGKGNSKIRVSVSTVPEFFDRVRAMSADRPVVTNASGLAINGNQIMETFQLKPGRMVGELLSIALEAVTENPELNNPADLMAFLKKHQVK